MVNINGVETENVVTPLDTDMSEGGILEVEDSRLDDAHAQAERVVKQAHDQSGTKGQIEIIVETGEPAETILTNIDNGIRMENFLPALPFCDR